MSRVRIVVAGAGLAGLMAARTLERAGAEVTVIEARDRVGGRVHTRRDFAEGQHAEVGADLIESEQKNVLNLAAELQLEPVRILRMGWGFYGASKNVVNRTDDAPAAFEEIARLMQPEVEAFKAAGRRWDSAVAQVLGRQSVADWIATAKVRKAIATRLCGLRGFFLADPAQLSLLMLIDQFASDEVPGEGRMFRLRDGNDSLPRAMAKKLRGRLLLNAVLKRVSRRGRGVTLKLDDGRLREVKADYAVIALPASTLRRVVFSPALPPEQWRAIRTLNYGAATRVLLQFSRRFWRKPGRPSAYGSDRAHGAVWDGNEQQARRPGILSLLAGGGASREVRALIRERGWMGLVRDLEWLGTPAKLIGAASYAWENDAWAGGGYAVFDSRYDAALRPWLARPAGLVVFAGEHTSQQSQGYMNGALESGRRAAIEVALMAGLPVRGL